MFYIFGGAFGSGDASKEGPEFLMSRDVVLVMVNHRLGVLGFLSTADTVISGNMGLKDQVLAMKWTKENIYDFGGDPRRITLHGHSSGAVSAHLHTISPLSRGTRKSHFFLTYEILKTKNGRLIFARLFQSSNPAKWRGCWSKIPHDQ